MIPEAVYEDLVIKGRGRPGATEVESSTWIHRRVVTDPATLAPLPSPLHLGERDAIVLAQELGAQLLIDERRGRKNAVEQGLEVFGSLRVLAEAKRLSLIEQVKPILEAMLGSGYWIDEELIPPFLQEIGEADI